MKKQKLCIVCLIVTLCWGLMAGTLLRQEHLSSNLIRIHVLANSDSEADQAEKLRVRDAVLQRVSLLTAGAGSRAEAAEELAAHAEELAETAASETDLPVTVSLSPEWYEMREYETFSLPAGRYLSLRVQIGAAEGHNWWCVAFPSVCTAATAKEFQTVAVSGGLSGEDLRMMTEDDPEIEVRYFVLELLEKLRDTLRG